MRTKVLLLALFLLAAPALLHAAAPAGKSAGASTQPVKLSFAIGDPEDSEMGMLALAFKNYVTSAAR